jgi:hypothetical protein
MGTGYNARESGYENAGAAIDLIIGDIDKI